MQPSPIAEKTQLKLYGGARTRDAMVRWYLQELAVSYEYVPLDIRAEEHLKPEFLAINPMGKLPAIVDGDFKLWESGAILPKKLGLKPRPSRATCCRSFWRTTVVISSSSLIY